MEHLLSSIKRRKKNAERDAHVDQQLDLIARRVVLRRSMWLQILMGLFKPKCVNVTTAAFYLSKHFLNHGQSLLFFCGWCRVETETFNIVVLALTLPLVKNSEAFRSPIRFFLE
jgi:hypothetical protein